MTDLTDYLARSAVVEQAKGVLVQRFNVTPEVAGDHLLRWATQRSQPVAEIAHRVVATAYFKA